MLAARTVYRLSSPTDGWWHCRAASEMIEHFACGFAIPKFAAAGEAEHDIMDLGGLDLSSTDFGERSHRDIKAAVPFNNHHRSDELRQART